MKLVRIFADNDCLLSFQYDGNDTDEFSRLFDEWTDIEYLESFFTGNVKDLQRPAWLGISIDEAILRTRNEAIQSRKYLRKLIERPAEERIASFVKFFKPLETQQSRFDFLDKKKAYGSSYPSWLRMYALKIGDDMYLITGGTIKLTDRMDERVHTNKELRKIEACKDFLLEQGIIDESGVIELLEF